MGFLELIQNCMEHCWFKVLYLFFNLKTSSWLAYTPHLSDTVALEISLVAFSTMN